MNGSAPGGSPSSSSARTWDSDRRLPELLEELLRVLQPEGLPHEGALLQRWLQVLVRRDVVPLVEDAEADTVPLLVQVRPLVRPPHRREEVQRVVPLLLQGIDPLTEPVVRVDLVVRHARAQDVDQGEALVFDPPREQVPETFRVPA